MKNFIHNNKIFLDQNDTFSNQNKWNFWSMKYVGEEVMHIQKLEQKNLKRNMHY